jgi:hypothetical protein
MVTFRIILLNSIRYVFHNSKFVLLMWAVNAATALILTVPVFNVLYDNLGHSLLSDRLTEGFDYMWYVQFRNLYSLQLDQIPLNIYFVVGLYTLVQTFFLGGLISIFHTPDKNHTVDFFFGGVRYFIRFIKVLIVSLFFFALAFKINDYTGELITWLFANSENAAADFTLKALRYILLIFLIGFITMLSDYAKVALAVGDKIKVLKELYSTMNFIIRNFNQVFLLFLLVAVIGALGAVVYNIVGRFIPRTPFYFLILSFILQQMLIIFRLLVRMLFCSTEVNLYKDLSADVINVESN